MRSKSIKKKYKKPKLDSYGGLKRLTKESSGSVAADIYGEGS